VWPLRVADTRFCADGKPLPPVAGDAACQSGGRDAVAARDLYKKV